MNGGSSAPYLTRTPCVPLLCTLFNRGGNRRAFRLPGAGGDHFHCTVETFVWSYPVSKMGFLFVQEIGIVCHCPRTMGRRTMKF